MRICGRYDNTVVSHVSSGLLTMTAYVEIGMREFRWCKEVKTCVRSQKTCQLDRDERTWLASKTKTVPNISMGQLMA
jgi:hypothetical protein